MHVRSSSRNTFGNGYVVGLETDRKIDFMMKMLFLISLMKDIFYDMCGIG